MAITIDVNDQIKEMRLEILGNVNTSTQDELFRIMLNKAKHTYLSKVYPFNDNIDTLPNDRAVEWQTKCAIEYYKMAKSKFKNVKSYSENGLSISFGTAGLSQDLLDELPPPKAGVLDA